MIAARALKSASLLRSTSASATSLQKDQILIVDCTVSMDDYSGGMQGRGKEVMTLEQARQRRARSITLSLRSDALAVGFSERLAEMLESHRLKPSDSVQSPPFGSAAAAS